MSLMKFYMTPGSCTTGIHILLEELELLFEVHPVNLLAGDHETKEYRDLNPKSSIPMLVTEQGKILTEFQAIAWWLGRSYPKQGLLGKSIDDEVRIIEMLDYVVATLHMQGFARIFTTEKFCSDESQHEAIKQQGKEIINKAFDNIDKQLASKNYVIDEFSIADAGLFYTEFWANKMNIELPANCAAHYQYMINRSAVRQVLMEEGYRVTAASI